MGVDTAVVVDAAALAGSSAGSTAVVAGGVRKHFAKLSRNKQLQCVCLPHILELHVHACTFCNCLLPNGLISVHT